jgi:hypothetical protein
MGAKAAEAARPRQVRGHREGRQGPRVRDPDAGEGGQKKTSLDTRPPNVAKEIGRPSRRAQTWPSQIKEAKPSREQRGASDGDARGQADHARRSRDETTPRAAMCARREAEQASEDTNGGGGIKGELIASHSGEGEKGVECCTTGHEASQQGRRRADGRDACARAVAEKPANA